MTIKRIHVSQLKPGIQAWNMDGHNLLPMNKPSTELIQNLIQKGIKNVYVNDTHLSDSLLPDKDSINKRAVYCELSKSIHLKAQTINIIGYILNDKQRSGLFDLMKNHVIISKRLFALSKRLPSRFDIEILIETRRY